MIGSGKTCTKCGRFQSFELFYNRKLMKDGKGSWCKDCMDAKRKQNPPSKLTVESRRKARVWCKNNPRSMRNKRLKKYGITVEEYDRMFEAQRGLCAICGHPETTIDARYGKMRMLSVDHCHTTGKVRGLLCGHCNIGLGSFKDDASLLAHAITYLGRVERL